MMKSYFRWFDRKAELLLRRCWDVLSLQHSHANVLRARGDVGLLLSLIEDTLYLSANGSALSGKKRSIDSDSSRPVFDNSSYAVVITHNDYITTYRIPLVGRPKKKLYNSDQGAHFSAFIYQHLNDSHAYKMTWSESSSSRFFKLSRDKRLDLISWII